MPLRFKSKRRAKRIRKSRPHKCLSSPSRTGRPYEYQKAARTSASQVQVGRVGQTNTKKPPARLPLNLKSEGQAIRIPESCPHECLSSTSRKGGPDEYQKAARTSASEVQVGPAGYTNTRKPPAQVPLKYKSEGWAKRIRKSRPHKCLSSSSRKGRPNEYEKAARTIASKPQVGRAGQTNTKKPPAQVPLTFKSKREANCILFQKLFAFYEKKYYNKGTEK